MSLKLMYITNDESIARIADQCGVNWIFIDLEILGKEERQGHLNSVISRHRIEDVQRIKQVLSEAKLLVRVNPIFKGSRQEIDQVIEDGADIVMLPFFKTRDEVEKFIDYVGGRAATCLLLETAEAVESIDDILTLGGIDSVHIGLNDLHLAYKMRFMFELLADGTVDMLCKKLIERNIPYGFGGIAQIGQGDLPAEYIIAEHYRLGSTMVILSRSFCNVKELGSKSDLECKFRSGVKEIRDYEEHLKQRDESFFDDNRKMVAEKVAEIISCN